MNELLLIVTIAGSRVALPAAAVESVVELDMLIPVLDGLGAIADIKKSQPEVEIVAVTRFIE